MMRILFTFIMLTTIATAGTPQMETLEKLNKKNNFYFRETTLVSVLQSLGGSVDINIRFHSRELAGKTASIEQQNISLGNALEMMLQPYGLSFTIEQDGGLRITSAKSESTLRGVVRTAPGNEAAPSVNIFLQNTRFGTTSDANGAFKIRGIPPGIYDFTVRLIGYKTLQYELILSSGKTLDLNLELQPDVLQMQAIVKTAHRERQVIQSEVSSFSIKTRQLGMMPAFGEKDVFQSMQMLPGVVVTNEFKSQLYIRGGNSDQNLVMLDGAVMYNPFHFSGILSAFDVDAVEKVDFYAGGFCAQYGGRLSSVVDIRTRTGAGKWKNHIGLSPLSVKFLTEAPLWHWGNILLTARKSYINYAAKKMGGEVQPEFYDGIGTLTVRPSKHDTIKLSAFYGNDIVKLQKSAAPEVMTSTNLTSALNYHRDFADRLFLDFKTSYGEFGTTQPQPLDKNEAQLNNLKDVNSTLILRYSASSRLHVQAGVDYRETDIYYKSADPVVAEMLIDKLVKEKAAFVQGRWSPDHWHFDLGLRAAQYGNNNTVALEPRLAATLDLYNFLSLKTAYGEYSQNLVTIYNENDTYNPVDIWLPPDPDLALAHARHFIVGANYHSTAFMLSTEIYYRTFDNLTQYNRERLFADDPFFIQGTGESYGMDISAQYFADRWQLWFGYSLAKATKTLPFTYPEPGLDTFAPRYDRRHNLNIAIEYKITDRFVLSSRFHIASGLPFAFMIGAYKRWSTFVINAPSDWFAGPDALKDYYLTAIMSERDAFRYPTYHRLDVALKYEIRWGRMQINPYVQIINTYNQQNVLYYDVYAKPHTTVPFLPLAGLDITF